MTWLTPPDATVEVPRALTGTPLVGPSTTAREAGAVVVGTDPELLVPVAGVLPTHVVYERLPLPHRGPLLLRAGTLDRLAAAAARLPAPFGLTVLDGWRSPAYQRALLTHYRTQHPGLEDGWVSDDDGDVVPPHTTGGAVDLTLSWHGTPLALGTDFDAFDDSAHPGALERPGLDATAARCRDLRRMLAGVLGAEGLSVYPMEWWHWSYGDQWWAAAHGRARSVYGPVTEPPA